jgi:hypothetical protein
MKDALPRLLAVLPVYSRVVARPGESVPLTVDTPARIAYTVRRYHLHLDLKKGGRPVVGQVNVAQVVQHLPESAGARL